MIPFSFFLPGSQNEQGLIPGAIGIVLPLFPKDCVLPSVTSQLGTKGQSLGFTDHKPAISPS